MQVVNVVRLIWYMLASIIGTGAFLYEKTADGGGFLLGLDSQLV
ncbi:MAG: hypothetical protein Q8P73_01030 [bacterium]|nr:hypothetical protein [bacterium]